MGISENHILSILKNDKRAQNGRSQYRPCKPRISQDDKRKALEMHDKEHMTYKEIADLTGISKTTLLVEKRKKEQNN